MELEFIENNYSHQVLHNLNSQRKRKESCNLTVHVDTNVFFVHRNVLAAISPFVQDMICDVQPADDISITIDTSYMSPESVEQLIDYFYTGKVILSDRNIADLIRGAKFFILLELRANCQEYLVKSMHIGNCIRNLTLAEAFDMKEVGDNAYACLQDGFYSTASGGDSGTGMSTELLECPYKTFSRLIKDENLHVHNEDQVLLSVIKWVEHNPDERIQYFDNLFSFVGLHGVSDKVLLHISKQEQLVMTRPSAQIRIESVLNSRKQDSGFQSLPAHFSALQRKGAHQDTVLVLGGQRSDNSFSESVFAYILEENRWTKVTDMPYRTAALSATTSGKFVYISGGATEAISGLKSAWKYDIYANSWSKMPDLPVGLVFHTMVVCGGSIYTVGGSIAPRKYTSNIYRFDNLKGKWVLAGKMSVAMDGPEVVTRYDKILYIVTGRCTVNGVLSRIGVVDCFDTDSGEVVQCLTFPIDFKHRPLVSFQGSNFLCVQSHTQGLEINLQTVKMNILGSTTPLMPLDYKMDLCQARCHVSDSKVFVCGGIISAGANLRKSSTINKNACIYDKQAGEWQVLVAPPEALDCAACCKAQLPCKYLAKVESTICQQRTNKTQ
ncbi:calicin-like [Ascaphus truei]|uniref:calicin-like n=1 Tax=Ascaphus truei TaxID=8439 RepID=UPI003F5A26A5